MRNGVNLPMFSISFVVRERSVEPHTPGIPSLEHATTPSNRLGGPLFTSLFSHQEDSSDLPTCVYIALIFSFLEKKEVSQI